MRGGERQKVEKDPVCLVYPHMHVGGHTKKHTVWGRDRSRGKERNQEEDLQAIDFAQIKESQEHDQVLA